MEIKSTLKKHAPTIVFLIIIIFFGAVGYAYIEETKSKMEKIKNAEIGLYSPRLLQTADQTKVYSLVDEDYGINLAVVISDWGLNPPVGISGFRYKPATISPVNGNEQIGKTVLEDQTRFPTIFRYVSLQENKIVYYEENHACTFSIALNLIKASFDAFFAKTAENFSIKRRCSD